MRRQIVIYASLIAVAIAFGIVAAGLPSSHSDPVLRTSAAVPTTSASTTSSTIVAPTTSSTIVVPTTHPHRTVTVLVANASGVTANGAASVTALGHAGYRTLTTVDTTASSRTAVYFLPGYRADAAAVALLIGAPAAVRAMPAKSPVPNLSTANLLVVVGSDLAHT